MFNRNKTKPCRRCIQQFWKNNSIKNYSKTKNSPNYCHCALSSLLLWTWTWTWHQNELGPNFIVKSIRSSWTPSRARMLSGDWSIFVYTVMVRIRWFLWWKWTFNERLWVSTCTQNAEEHSAMYRLTMYVRWAKYTARRMPQIHVIWQRRLGCLLMSCY